VNYSYFLKQIQEQKNGSTGVSSHRHTRGGNESRMSQNSKNLVQPSAQGSLARRVRSEWRSLSKAFGQFDPTKRGVVTERELQKIFVSHASPVPLKQLKWLISTFRKGASDLVDYKAVMTYFSPLEPLE